MTGSTPFLIEKSTNFERSFTKLVKTYKSQSQKQEFIQIIREYLDELIINPYPPQARVEPLPSGLKLPDEWQFYKLVVTIAKGASGQIRLMYLVEEKKRVIKPLWIYNHQQFERRPPDRDIKDVIQEIFEE
ncbi:MAG: type II toxin-antitoxin system RelE/ParE family toxin [Okeania sp. SIO2H7]|nr:type II toxin-antitoxin system RelE/ParE family toxin [Okeania sp. SIO2H7]